jgi:hypothetical protein
MVFSHRGGPLRAVISFACLLSALLIDSLREDFSVDGPNTRFCTWDKCAVALPYVESTCECTGDI